MTEHQSGKRSWGTKQNWIKDALTKSGGSELVDVTRNKTKAAQKKLQTNAKGKGKESRVESSRNLRGNKGKSLP